MVDFWVVVGRPCEIKESGTDERWRVRQKREAES